MIRTSCLINNNKTEPIWNYYNNDKEKIADFFEKAYGKMYR